MAKKKGKNAKKSEKKKLDKTKKNKKAKKTKSKGLKSSKTVNFEGVDIFSFWNGDTYIGQFLATSKKSIIRKGYGRYFTGDGTIYTGEWVKDKLVNGTVVYPNHTVYSGPLNNHKYDGEGTYTIENVGSLAMTFKDNIPIGEMVLTDIQGYEWVGTQTAPGKAVLLPRNHFKDHNLTCDAQHGEWM